MEYHVVPLLEAFFTEEKKKELLAELQVQPNGGPVFEAFLRYYTAKAIDEDELTLAVFIQLKSLAYTLIDSNNDGVLKTLLEINASFVTFSSGFCDLCPLCYAIYKKKNWIAIEMINSLSLDDIENIDSTPPGYVAIAENNYEIVVALLEKGCNTARFAREYTALQFAVLRLNEKMVQQLLDFKVDVNEVAEFNKYPALTFAVQQDDYVIVKTLLKCPGIMVNQLDNTGLRPIDYARSERMKQLLQNTGAEETPKHAKILCAAVLALHEENDEDPLQLTKELVMIPGASSTYEDFDLLYEAVKYKEYEIASLLLKNKLVFLSDYKKDLVKALFFGSFYEDCEWSEAAKTAKQLEKFLNLLIDYDYHYPFSLSEPKPRFVRHMVLDSLSAVPSNHYLKLVLPKLLSQIGFDISSVYHSP